MDAVDCIQDGVRDSEGMEWVPCSVLKCILSECSGVHEAWGNVSRVNAVDSMQHGEMDTD